MNNATKRSAFSAIATGTWGGLQARLLLLWILITLLPTLVVALPLWGLLDGLLGHSVHADAWAKHFDGLMFGDVVDALQQGHGWFGMAFVAGVLLTLAISPFLTGMVIASGRAGRQLGFGALLQGGAAEYGRMLRLLILGLVPYGIFVLVANSASSFVEKKVDVALLPTTADHWDTASLVVTVVFFVLAQAVIESARAQFIADLGLRSAFRALGRGFMQVLRRPFATLLVYVVITLVGGVLALLIASWRGHTVASGGGAFIAFLIVQLGVVVVAWMRTARLFGLATLSPLGAVQRRRRSDFAPAL